MELYAKFIRKINENKANGGNSGNGSNGVSLTKLCLCVNNNSLMFGITINILFAQRCTLYTLSSGTLRMCCTLFAVQIVAFVSSNIDFHSLSLLLSLLYPVNFRSVL